jgi:hypothetical protein
LKVVKVLKHTRAMGIGYLEVGGTPLRVPHLLKTPGWDAHYAEIATILTNAQNQCTLAIPAMENPPEVRFWGINAEFFNDVSWAKMAAKWEFYEGIAVGLVCFSQGEIQFVVLKHNLHDAGQRFTAGRWFEASSNVWESLLSLTRSQWIVPIAWFKLDFGYKVFTWLNERPVLQQAEGYHKFAKRMDEYLRMLVEQCTFDNLQDPAGDTDDLIDVAAISADDRAAQLFDLGDSILQMDDDARARQPGFACEDQLVSLGEAFLEMDDVERESTGNLQGASIGERVTVAGDSLLELDDQARGAGTLGSAETSLDTLGEAIMEMDGALASTNALGDSASFDTVVETAERALLALSDTGTGEKPPALVADAELSDADGLESSGDDYSVQPLVAPELLSPEERRLYVRHCLEAIQRMDELIREPSGAPR